MHWQQRRTVFAEHHSPPDVSALLSAPHLGPTTVHTTDMSMPIAYLYSVGHEASLLRCVQLANNSSLQRSIPKNMIQDIL